MHLVTIGGVTASSLPAAAAGATLLYTVAGAGSGHRLGGLGLANSSAKFTASTVGAGGLKAFVYDITDGSLEYQPAAQYSDCLLYTSPSPRD